MKINKAYPIEELMEAVRYYVRTTNRRITFEYIMLNGVNDAVEDAQGLVKLIRHINCHVNLIPYNKVFENEYDVSSKENIKKFYEELLKSKVNCTVRVEKGSDIDAACGQLRAKYVSA